MGDMAKRVDLGAAGDPGLPVGAAIHGTVGADYHVVFYHDVAALGHPLPVHVLVANKSEPIGADDNRILTTITKRAKVKNKKYFKELSNE